MKKHDGLLALLILLFCQALISSNAIKIASEYEFSQQHYNATVFKFKNTPVQPQRTLISLKTDKAVSFRVADDNFVNFFVPWSEHVAGVTFLRLRTTNLAASSRNFTGTLAVPISAEIAGVPTVSPRCILYLKVLAVTELCPFISAISYTFSIDSTQSLFSTIGHVQVEVPSGGETSYVLYLRDLSPVFTLNPHTGALVLTSRPLQKEYKLRAIVVNPKTRSCPITENYSDVLVTVIVKDLDRVSVQQITGTVNVLNHVNNLGKAGSVFAWLNLTGASNRSSVQILNSEANNYFEFVHTSDSAYRLQLRNDFSFSPSVSQRQFNVNFSVTDPVDQGQHFTGNFIVNPNDRSLLGIDPTNLEFFVSVPECMPVGSIIFQFHSTIYNQTLPHIKYRYNMLQGNSYVHLDEDTGVLVIKSPLDAESAPKLSIFARIRDADNLRRLIFHTLTVDVTDCNEFAPSIANNATVHSVSESATVGTTVLTVDADDADATPSDLIVSIAESPEVPFGIVGKRIVVSRSLDSETMAANYTLYVRVSDQGQPIPRESLAIYYVNINPEDEFRPEFESDSCVVDLLRSDKSFETGHFPALDLDYPFAPVTYKIFDDPLGGRCFTISSTTGNLKLVCDLNGVINDQIVLSIVATDRAGRESPKLRVRFNILDNLQFSTKRTRCVQHVRSVTELYEANKKARNSHEVSVQMFESLQSRSFGDHLPNRPPLLNSVLSSFSVPENIGIGQTVASFFAEDQDPYGSYNGRLQFRIDSGNIGYAFNVTQRLDKFSTDETDDSEGSRRVSLVVLNELDREKRETYMLNITVCDMGEPSYCSTLSHVMIRVLDVNDNSPLLESPVFDVTVPEDTPIGTEICRFSATDPDAGSNGTVRYSVSDTNAFSINSNTGVLRTASRDLLDRESVSVYDLLVRAHDSGQPERSSELHFRVNIADENDHAPTFITKSPGPSSSERLALTISEDIPVNSFLTRLIAVDSDYGENGRIVYSLSGVPKVLSHFVIDQDSGCLYLAKPLSAALSPYQLFVDARDSAIAPKRSRISLNINVVAAVPPPVYIIFSEAVYSFSLSEDVRVGTSVGRINTTIYPNIAASSSITVGYVITSGSGLGRFTIDQTGEIRTRIPLDRESQPAGLWLTVHAYLLAGQTVVTHAEEKISICQVYINLEDVNDYRPMPTEQTHYRLQLVEAAPAGTVLLSSIPAMDQDLGDNASIVYAITDGNTAGHFRIEPETGRLTTTELAVDREVADQFLLTVSLADRGAPPLSTDLLVEIAVSDLNDSPPKFVRPLFQVTAIADSSAEGTSNDDEQVLLTRLPAVDKDLLENATILYSLQPSGSGVRISKSTGELSISRRLLRLDTGVGSNMMTFTVVAKDAGRLELSAMASVKLTIEQQQPTLPEPDAGTAVDLFQIDVSGEDGADAVVRLFDNLALEDSVPRLLVTPAVTMATKMLFTLTGRGSEDFYMPQSGGRLQLIRRLSHARQAVYNLTVGARLGARLQTKSLLLLVSQSNRNSPMFSKPVYDTSVTEGANLQLLQVFATDPDPGPTGHLQYSLVSAAQSASLDHFSLEPLTGRLAAMPPPSPPLNHESAGIHELLVRAVDSYSTDRRFSLARVIVTVTNENEHYPVVVTARPSLPDLPAGASIAQRQYQAEALNKMSRSPQEPALLSASVLANARPGYPLLQVYAFDLDSGRSGQLAYSVISGNDLGLFDLDSETGQLSTGKLLVDFAGHNLSLSLAVSDLGSPPKASLCLVSIRIINHEPNRPVVFGQHHYNVKIVEEAPPGSFVIKVDAKANDMPLVYSITSGNELGLFDIAPSTGVLIVKNPVDRETHGDFFRLGVQVQAVDTRLAVLTEVLVNVLDVNDNRPAFLSDRLSDGVVSEDAQRGQIVREAGRPRPLTIKAADADFGVNQELTYEIADPAADAAFSVDPVTGAIRVSQPLDRETRDLYEFDVWVRDSGTPKRLRSAKPARVRIRILDVNDCPPQYSRADYYTVLELPSYDGARLARIRAYDRDLNNSVSLSIVSGNADGLFQLHPVSGLLTLARPELLREHYYFLVISATDSVHVSLTNISINARQRTANLQLLPANLTVHVQENSAEVTTLAKFRPYPAPLNYPYRFSLISPSEYFSVNSITGVLATTGRPMDAEQARRHVLLVRATAESKLGFAQVTVQVDDTNDNRPVFVNRPYNTIMFAGQPLGSVALIARAIDADSGANGLVRYELRNHHSEFWINATGGQVYTRKIIEQPAVFTLELRAIDAGSPIQQFSTVAATVQVVANNTPVFPNGSVTVSVSESLRPNSEIFTVQAEAPGSATLIYTIESGNVGEMFSLDFQTGVVKTTDKLDYETIPHYQLTVRVTEPSLKTFTDMQLVINVTDVNDERPEFTASSFDVTVSEHEDPQRKVLLTASATDRDSGAGGEVTYSIEELADGSSDGASFSVDPTSGQLRLSLRLDYETKRQHQFWIVAADRGSPSQSARVPVTIRVADYNDCSPKFRLQTYNVSIAEQSRPGTFVAKVTAVDPDESSELTYSLESSFDAYQFRIDPEYGTIRYQPIQTSLGRTFRLAVLVTDSVHSDRAIVLVNLLPGPAGPPRCAEPLFHAKVLENSLPGSLLDQAQVRTIGGAELVYQSFSDKINRLLDIDRRTGRISTRVSLDREGPDPIRTLDFAVLASGSGGLHATCSVVISVLNENDNPPVFDPQPTEIVLTEDAPVGTVAFRLRTTDLDDPNRPIDNYRLLNESPLFAVNTTSGLVTLKRSFASYTASMAVDRADLRLHQLTVSARDWEPPYHQTRLDLAVRFAPGPLPEFRLVCSGMASASDDLRLSENSPAGTRLVSCRAQINGSFTSAYQASLAFGESDVRLLIAGDNLTVVSSRPYDRERESAIRFALSARSAGTRPTLPTFRAFRLDILNQPDMPPAFETAEYNLEVSEAAPVGSTLLQARAVDPDGDFPLTYQLLPASGGGGGGGNDSGSASPLRIGQQSGLVTVAAPLDRDSPLATPRAYRLLATDSSGMTGEARLVISLVDVNDEPLTWPTEDASDSTMLSEDAPVDTEVARLSIRDRDDTDRPPVRFYFASRPPAEFDLTEDGRLMLSGQLDRERQDAYEFDILATDGVFTTERAWRQRVLVRDVNDNAPVCRQPLQKLKLSEGLAVGYAVATVVATDADTQEKGLGLLEYFIVYSGNNSAEAAGLFSVDRHSGLVILAAKLDRETADWHSVTVLASDGKFNCSSTLEIQVLDENDCEPEFTARSLPPVPEDIPQGSVIGKVHAEDCDTGENRRIVYSIQPNVPEAAYFRIDPKSGIISVDFQKLDRETTPVHRIPVIATDSGVPQLSTTQTVSLTLMDVNDNPPEFVRSSLDFSLSESTPVGYEITRLNATSKDDGNNAVIRYQLMDHDNYFSLSATEGTLTVKSALDYERQQVYYLTVKAYDLGEPPLSATAVVTVKVIDENDNAPEFPADGFRVSVKENEPPGTPLSVKVLATDADSGENGRLTYKILDGDPDRMFALDTNSGQLVVRTSPDRELKDSYTLTVMATDHGSTPFSASTTVKITVLDVNDCVPQFDRAEYAFVLQIDDRGNVSQQPYMDTGSFLPPDGNLIGVTDCDAPPNGAPFSWSILDGSPRYSISRGRVRAKPGGGYVTGTEKIRVQVCDSGDIIRCNHTTVSIRIVKADSVPPKILAVNMTSNFYYDCSLQYISAMSSCCTTSRQMYS
ncbi:hypothetical protein BOX15_Mlig029482g2 [Macrostomum lignano]|uniref:Cadherin domain-containing protein n=1 Tax=Macrostomum lignano TaxID=282301 RepID=A0A267GH45_9PLAT|nr:hypothetical protein BOX15_Mlig029482g2 [Macrostomum lignano]